MAENKTSFIFYTEWKQDFEFFTDEEAGKLIKQVLRYVSDENPELQNEDRLLQYAFQKITTVLKKDLRKYEETCKKRSEAGKKGGVNSGKSRTLNQIEANEANASIAKQNEPEYEYEYDNEYDYDVLLEKEPKGSFLHDDDLVKNPEPETSKKVAQKKVSFQPPDPNEVQQYCDERQNKLNGQEFCDFYTSKGWMIGKNKMKDWKAAVRTWEKSRNNGNTNNNNRPNTSKVSGTAAIITGIGYTEFT